jgi:aldehyde dehydrogenase (NAD+)
MSIHKEEVADVFQEQVTYFKSGATRSYSFRKKTIKALLQGIKEHEEEILDALYSDFHKDRFEAYASEIGFIYAEIKHCLKWLKEWMRPQSQPGSMITFPARSYVQAQPKGQVLILSPWNYPFNLLINPLLAALAAGNTAMLKLPRQTPATAAVVDKILSKIYPHSLVACVDIEDQDVIPSLIKAQNFQHIFFTGSVRVGKLIYAAAADKMTEVTLELGGKSPAIIDGTADLKVAAKRIIWGKTFNAGQTCIAPDHLWVHSSVKEKFQKLLVEEADRCMKAYGGNEKFTYIINDERFKTLEDSLKNENVVFESGRDAASRFFGLCIVDEPTMESPLMNEEIFGPILPVLSWTTEEELREKINQNPNPLSFYIFTKDRKFEKRMIEGIPFGGGCVNDCLVHFANTDLPFGGVGTSGIGRYHGRDGFDSLSYKKSITKNTTLVDVPIRYTPYPNWKSKIIKMLLK